MVTKTETIRARVAPQLKHRAEAILEALGMNASQAITLFYRQIELHNGLPFDLVLPPPNAETRHAIEAAAKGEELVACADETDLYAKLGIG